MRIETARTVIRDFRADDLYDLYEILSDDETMEYVEPPYSLEKTSLFLRDFCIGKRGALAVEQKCSGKVIGYLLFKPYGAPDEYEIGWIFNRSVWCRGYAHETCDALIKYAFSAMSVRKIFAETVDMVRSAGLMKKLGMMPENGYAESENLYYCSLTKSEQ